MRLVGLGLLVLGGLSVWRTTRWAGRRAPARRRYRAGPWPGLAPAGAAVLLGCALLLAGGQLVLGEPRRPLPDVPLLAILALLPMALATRLVQSPGAATAACGAYLMPRALASLIEPSIEPPPLLLVPALAFDLTAWLRASDLAGLPHLTRGARRRARAGVTVGVTGSVTPRAYAGGGRRGLVGPRRCGPGRAGLAGAVFGGVLWAIEPSFAVLLGADPSAWIGAGLWLAGATTALGCAAAGVLGASRSVVSASRSVVGASGPDTGA